MPQHSTRLDPIRLQLFGGPRLFLQAVEVPLSPFQAALLALVFGTEKQTLEKEFLFSLLWPEDEPPAAGPRLSQLLYSLKERVGERAIVESRRNEIRRPTLGISTDLSEFNFALVQGSLRTCSSFLEKGFAPRTSRLRNRPLSDWIREREAELRRNLRNHAEKRRRSCSLEEDWEGALSAAQVLLELAPRQEEHLRQLLEAAAKAGIHEEAEKALRDFSDQLGEGVWVPEAETKALIEAIQPSPSPAAVPRIRESRSLTPNPPLLGREKERRLLRKTLTAGSQSELRGVVISGEAGIGKTRLIRESLRSLPIDGHRVFYSESAELEQLIPLNPLIEALKGPEAGGALRRLEEPWRTVLFGVMPSHYLGEKPIPEAPHIQPGSVPRRLFEAFHQLLLALVEGGPVVMVFEDLQWADETTLTVLEFLIRRWDHGKLQFVVSTRTEEIRKNDVLSRFLDNLRVHSEFLEVPLADLDTPESEALIQHLSATPLRKDDLTHLHSLAGGNPFFLIELTLEFLAGRLGPVVTPEDLVPIPLSIRQVLERRLSQLSPQADRVLGCLAVHSRPLETQGIADIAQLSGPECLSGLDQLHEFRLVASHQGAAVSITHELVRHTVYQALTSSRRAWLHGRVAEHILQTRHTSPPDELAVHFHLAGSSEEARRFAKESADRAESSGAIPEALRFLRIAREHSTDPEDVADLIGRMGHLNYLHQNLEEAAPLLELAAQRFRRQGAQARALEAEVERIDCLAQRGFLPGTECLEELGRQKDEASLAGLWGIYTKALDVEVHRLDHLGMGKAVEEVLEDAKRNADKGGPDARCRARAVLALNVYYGSPEVGLLAARESVRIAMETDDGDLQLHALNRLIVVLLYQGMLHTDEGRQAFELAESRLKKTGDLILKFFIRLNRAVWHLEIGELERARTAFLEVGPVIHGTGAKDAHVQLLLNEGELGLATFDVQSAQESFARAESLLEPSSPKAFFTIISSGLGMCALYSGDLAEARRRERALPGLPDSWTFDPSVVVTFKASMLRRRGDHMAADRLLVEVTENIKDRFVTAWIKLSIERGRVLMKRNRKKAIAILRNALDSVEKLGLEKRAAELKLLLND